MRVLMLSTDASILTIGSTTYKRMREYSGLVNELHIVVLSGKKGGVELHDGSLHIYPTNSVKKISRYVDAYSIASKIIETRDLNESDSLITCQDPFELGYIGLRIKKRFGLKLQLQVHTDFTNKYFISESIKNRLRNLLAWHTLKSADTIRVVSEKIKQAIATRFNKKNILILPIFIDDKAIEKTEPIDLHARFPQFNKFVVIASRLTNEKQVVWACEQLKSVVKKIPQLGIVILGDGPDRPALEKIPNVIVVGWTENVVGYMKGADVFLNTSLYEGYGRTLVEAVLAGTPVITTNVGIAREIIFDGENGFVVDVGSGEQLKEKVLKYFEMQNKFISKKPEMMSHEAYLEKYLATWSECFR